MQWYSITYNKNKKNVSLGVSYTPENAANLLILNRMKKKNASKEKLIMSFLFGDPNTKRVGR